MRKVYTVLYSELDSCNNQIYRSYKYYNADDSEYYKPDYYNSPEEAFEECELSTKFDWLIVEAWVFD